eukprot:TRINITY_DN1599_c0_g1_i1.p1 TRINITY_DN1599_c0_g1~~TRINITY_DN1599_c0_g1_i1.p1  ORF type:complete len:141 (+),score=10.94 TRINITY_DN1599_c0_g1_i1:65-487(+)
MDDAHLRSIAALAFAYPRRAAIAALNGRETDQGDFFNPEGKWSGSIPDELLRIVAQYGPPMAYVAVQLPRGGRHPFLVGLDEPMCRLRHRLALQLGLGAEHIAVERFGGRRVLRNSQSLNDVHFPRNGTLLLIPPRRKTQ